MSDSQAYEEVTVTSDGVTVVKRFEEDEFPVPAIAFEFASARDEEVTVRLVDRVPEGVAVEDLGFHPEYGSEYWTIDEEQITFERDLGANAEYTTVYGIRATGTDDVEQFLTEPAIENVDPPLPESETEEAEAAPGDGSDEVIPESDDDVVRDVISGEAEDVPGLEDDEEATDEEVETLDLKDPNEPESAQANRSAEGDAAADDADDADDAGGDGGGGGGGDGGEVEVDLEGSTLVTALANEIRQNNVSAEDVKLLRQAFEIAGQEGGSVVARIQRLQSDVSNLRAYTDALEEFLDDSGTAQQVIQGFEDDLDALESQLDEMQAEMQSNARAVDELSSDVDSVEEEVASVSDEMDSFQSEVDSVSDEVEEVSEDVSSVRNEVNGVSSNVEDLQEAIDDLESDLEEVREEAAGGEVESRVNEMESELEGLQEWQDQIKSTFGG